MQSLCQVRRRALPGRRGPRTRSAFHGMARNGAPMPTHGAPPAGGYQPRKRGQWAATRPESSWMTW